MADVDLIIPAYNAETTIRNTLASIEAQTVIDRIRVIIVDDASTDLTLDVVEQTILSFPNLAGRCVVKRLPENLGSAGAYNEGLKIADAEWLARCDADDCLMPDAIERMLLTAESLGADIICGAMLVDTGRDQRTIESALKLGLNGSALNTVNYSLCNKLIRRRLLLCAPDNIPLTVLPGINCWDDLSLTSRLMAIPGCRVVELEGNPVYRYCLPEGRKSLSRSDREYLLRQHMECAVRLTEWFEGNGLSATNRLFIMRLKFIAKVKMLCGRDALKRLKVWRSTFPETAGSIMDMKADMNLPLRLLFRVLSL